MKAEFIAKRLMDLEIGDRFYHQNKIYLVYGLSPERIQTKYKNNLGYLLQDFSRIGLIGFKFVRVIKKAA
jgi:hypothetical protein